MTIYANKMSYFSSLIIIILIITPCIASAASEGVVRKTGQKVDLLDDAVKRKHIADDAINSSKVKDGSLKGKDLAYNTITNTHVAFGTLSLDRFDQATQEIIRSNFITPDSITSTELADNAITNSKLANRSVTSNKIANGSIGMNHLAPDLRDYLNQQDLHNTAQDKRLDTHERGIAISMAANNIPNLPNKAYQVGIGIAVFGDSQAISARYQALINKNTALSLGGGLAEGTSAVNMGLGFGW